MPRNSLPNGEAAPDTGGLQLDETSYPILMDWQSGLAHDSSLYENHVIPAADFLVANGPSDGVERWEEQSGYSPSTIAAEIAGLTAAAAIARVNHDPTHAAIYQATADDFARNIENWTVTTNGPYISASVPEYFIRVTKGTNPTTGQADPDVPYDYMLNNGNMTNVDQRAVIDAGFLDLVRLGVLPANDPAIKSSLTVVDDTIERQTPSGPGFYRYGFANDGESDDGYGDCYQPSGSELLDVIGAPWPPTDTGTGHLWPVLSGERGEYEIAARRLRLRRPAADRDAEHDLGPGARARAGLGGPGPARLAVRHRSGHRLDRLHRRQARRLGQPAHLGPGLLRPPRARPQRRPRPRDAEDRHATAMSRHGMPGSLP